MAQHDSDFAGQSPSGETASNAANNSPNISQSGQITSICDDITPSGTSGNGGGGSGPTIVAQTIVPIIREQKGNKYVIKDLVRTLPAYLNNGIPGSSFPDLFRARSGYFWYRDDKYSTKPLLCVAKDRSSADTSSYDNYLAEGIPKVRFPIENFTDPTEHNNNSIGFYLEETLNMTYLQLRPWYDDNNIIGPILSAIDDKKFLDIAFDVERPTEQTTENSSLAPGKLLIKVENEYNAYVSLYEKVLSENDISSKVLPNMYLLLAENLTDPRNLMNIEEEKRQGISSDAYQQTLDLNPSSGPRNTTSQSMIVSMNYHLESLSSNGDEYIDRFSKLLSSPTNWRREDLRASWLEQTSYRMTNLVFSSREIKLFREFKSFREQFPFYINVNIDSPDLKTIGNSFYKSGFMDYLMAYVAKERENNKKVFRISDNAFEEETRDETQDFFDIKDIFSKLKTEENIFTTMAGRNRVARGNTTYVGLLEKDIIDFDSMEPSEKMDLSFLELEYDLLTNDLKNRYLRTMRDCFEGKSAYNDLIQSQDIVDALYIPLPTR